MLKTTKTFKTSWGTSNPRRTKKRIKGSKQILPSSNFLMDYYWLQLIIIGYLLVTIGY